MIYLPLSLEAGGAMLAAYIAADPARSIVYAAIRERLEPAGKVGDTARYYVVGNAFRRAVFRGILIAVGAKVPDWAKDNQQARADNQAFAETSRATYQQFRSRRRWSSGPAFDGTDAR